MNNAAATHTGVQFTRYAMVGLASNALGYGLYIVLTHTGLGPKAAMSVLYVVGVLQSFALNRSWSFRFSGAGTPALLRYLTIYALGYALNLAALTLLVDSAGLPHQWVMAGLLVFMALFFFAGQKFWVFRSNAVGTQAGAAQVTHQRWMFATYAYAENLLRLVLEILPPPLRYWVFKALLARLGAGSLIDYQTYFRYPWKTSVGNKVWINRGCEFYGSMLAGNAHISIGDHSALGPHVRVLSATHDHRFLTLPDQAASVNIGRHVWIGAGATILPGVNIGDGAVVGAGSVVTHDIAPYSIVAGNPARFIKNREVSDASTLQ